MKNYLAQNGDAAGGGDARPQFETLYTEHIGFVWRCLRALGVAPGQLDDAAQEVFMTVHRRLPEFRGDSSLRSWIYGILRNVASNHRRSERRRRPQECLSAELPCARESPLEHAQAAQAAAFIQRFLSEISEAKREMFVLVSIEQMSMPEVAEALQLSLNTAYARLRQVRLDFRRALQRERGEP